MNTKDCRAIAVASLALAMCFRIGFCYGPADTLRNEFGEIIPMPDPGECGVDYADSQFIASFIPGYLTLPSGQTEALLDSCSVDSSLSYLLQNHNVVHVRQVFAGVPLGDTMRVIDADTIYILDLSQIFVLRQLASCDVLDAVEDMYSHEATQFAEPNAYAFPANDPNDDAWDYGYHWNLEDPDYENDQFGIGCQTAWDYTQGNNAIRLGIVDSGIYYDHPDLGGGIGEGFKVVDGIDIVDPENGSPIDYTGHGTGVAGIAAGLTNNEISTSGIAGGWGGSNTGASLYAIKMTNPGGSLVENLAAAIRYGSDYSGFACDILNCSVPVNGLFDLVDAAVFNAYLQNTVIVGAKGNVGGAQLPNSPADVRYGNWAISVGAYGRDGRICTSQNCSSSTNWAWGIDISAPGVDIPILTLDDRYDSSGGGLTSDATPHVSGAVALLMSINNSLLSEDYEEILEFSAYDNPEVTDGNVWTWDDHYGHGLLNVSTAVSRLTDPDWAFFDHFAEGGILRSTSAPYTCRFYGMPLNDEYIVQRCSVVVFVPYSESFVELPFVWGLGARSRGWAGANPNYNAGWCHLVPGSQKLTKCQLFTYVYKVFEEDPLIYPGRFIGWYPCAPSEVRLHYRLWGQPASPGPKLDGGLSPGQISLVGNYPNPFNVTTSIKFSILEKSHVLLSVFDILGRKVNTLINKEILAGEYSVVWNGTDSDGRPVSSGIYYTRLEVADQARTARMTMLK